MAQDDFNKEGYDMRVLRTLFLPASLDVELAKLSDPRNRIGYSPVTGQPDARYKMYGDLMAGHRRPRG